MTTSNPLATLNPSIVGQAEKAHNAVLDRVLAGTGLDERQWITLQLAQAAGPIARSALVSRVSSAAKYDPAAVDAALAALATAGLVSASGDRVTVTDAGAAQVGALRAIVAELIGPAYSSVSEEDKAVAARVLIQITAALSA